METKYMTITSSNLLSAKINICHPKFLTMSSKLVCYPFLSLLLLTIIKLIYSWQHKSLFIYLLLQNKTSNNNLLLCFYLKFNVLLPPHLLYSYDGIFSKWQNLISKFVFFLVIVDLWNIGWHFVCFNLLCYDRLDARAWNMERHKRHRVLLNWTRCVKNITWRCINYFIYDYKQNSD